MKISIDRVSTKTETCALMLSAVRKAIGTIAGEGTCPTGERDARNNRLIGAPLAANSSVNH
ncbi:hypothetical protein [Streptomyces sp. NBC_01185]|uniref:hypothetical protein n=1 Tax=Streptomyces sp. NBC_01185 TaxID=2903764 RepID=UPI003866ADCD|nr:hypothetical protein OG770_00295 [Streptomyces sp. NBC_01185]